jgi:8-oxo-dGTP pyrophosphatase MutT (NUDIX family)
MKQIPVHATCVYDGAVFKVWQREQQMFDGTTQTFEGVERQSTAFVLPVQDGKIMLAYQRQPHKAEWYRDFVGGRVHRWTDPLAWAQRELLEEAGMQAQERTLRKEFDLGGGSVKWNRYFYVAKWLTTVWAQQLDPGGEDIQLKRVDKTTFEQMLLDDTLSALPVSNAFMRHKLTGTEEEFWRGIL